MFRTSIRYITHSIVYEASFYFNKLTSYLYSLASPRNIQTCTHLFLLAFFSSSSSNKPAEHSAASRHSSTALTDDFLVRNRDFVGVHEAITGQQLSRAIYSSLFPDSVPSSRSQSHYWSTSLAWMLAIVSLLWACHGMELSRARVAECSWMTFSLKYLW